MSKNRANKSRAWLARVLAPLLMAAAPCFADTYVMHASNGDYVKLFDTPCTVSSGWLKLHLAEFRYQGKVYAACWVLVGQVVVVLDEEGSATPVPMTRFRKEQGA